jgi:phenylalanyl-tRNA synthetase beta chain
MKISLAWLADFVALPPSPDEVADALTRGGTEVVGRGGRGDIPDKVVVAQILSSEPHPNADRLSVCQVDDGSGTPRQIVCGAKNYKVGDKVPLALPGAVLGPDFKIKSGKLRGVVSEGMMCSAKELALAEDAEGLLILPEDAAAGRPVGELFPGDTILELEVTPNRPDLLGHAGVARELGALMQKPASLPQPAAPQTAPAEAMVRLEDEGCPFYSARIIRGVKVGPSPAWLADRLTAVGLRPINNVVDVTNYVLMETGQPLHAFDLGRLQGGIVARAARDGETLAALDGSSLALRPHDLVIADHGGPVALAGVMGGAPTGVTGETTDVLLESAWFEPARVRRSSRELALQTDSSYRFERRVDPRGVLPASARATELILQVAGGTAGEAVLVAGVLPPSSGEVSLDPDRCRALLGFGIADAEIADILGRLGLAPAGPGVWRVPSFRPDLTREVDLIEEVIRMAGIERVPSRLRSFPAPAGPADVRHDRAALLRERLRARGFSEARSSHFLSADALRRSGLDQTGAVAVRNPLGADQALLRPALRPGLLSALAHNLRHGAAGVRLFEIGRVFSSGGSEEQTSLGLITTGEKAPASWQGPAGSADFHDIKGVLAAVLGPLDFLPAPGLALEVRGRGVSGTVSRLSRAVAGEFDAKAPVHCAELLVDGWLGAPEPAARVEPLPRFPAVQRDLSLVLPHTVPFATVEQELLSARAPHLRCIALSDVFADPDGVRLPADQRSLTVTLTFREEGRTLTSEEVDRAMETLRDRAKSALGAAFRG